VKQNDIIGVHQALYQPIFQSYTVRDVSTQFIWEIVDEQVKKQGREVAALFHPGIAFKWLGAALRQANSGQNNMVHISQDIHNFRTKVLGAKLLPKAVPIHFVESLFHVDKKTVTSSLGSQNVFLEDRIKGKDVIKCGTVWTKPCLFLANDVMFRCPIHYPFVKEFCEHFADDRE
jgi:hypothetical protein